jgi:hypothetical protein
MDFFIETGLLRDLSCLFLVVALFSFFWSKANQKLKEENLEKKIEEWWSSSIDEEDFVKKFKIFLEIYPTSKKRKGKKKIYAYLKKIKEILKKQYFREEIISSETYEKLLDLIEEKEKQLLSR